MLMASCPGGFGDRGIEGKIAAIRYAREKKNTLFGNLPGNAAGCNRVAVMYVYELCKQYRI